MKDDKEDILRDLLSDHKKPVKHAKRSFVITYNHFRVVITHRGGMIENIRVIFLGRKDEKGFNIYTYADSSLKEIMKYRYWSITGHRKHKWPSLRITHEITEENEEPTEHSDEDLNR